MNLSLTVEVFREGDQFVTLCPELNLSGFGGSIEAAKASFREALEAFVEECQEIGTIDEVLLEAGFTKEKGEWQSRRPVAEEHMTLSIS
ncbi:MAG: hypothetical protein IEMM0008_1183 [bacterium]|nr:MAG: hypothetical protein IEMM0008_1183 [bacterium]